MTQDEQWAAIPGFEGIYEASSLGRIRSLQRYKLHRGRKVLVKERILKFLEIEGYNAVALSLNGKAKQTLVHRLVLLAFVGEPIMPAIFGCHRDGDKKNNRISNLRWGTYKDNADDAIRLGRTNLGTNHHFAKLSDDDIRAIRLDTRKLKEIARDYGVSESYISRLKRFAKRPKLLTGGCGKRPERVCSAAPESTMTACGKR
jgi:hypothetical protein